MTVFAIVVNGSRLVRRITHVRPGVGPDECSWLDECLWLLVGCPAKLPNGNELLPYETRTVDLVANYVPLYENWQPRAGLQVRQLSTNRVGRLCDRPLDAEAGYWTVEFDLRRHGRSVYSPSELTKLYEPVTPGVDTERPAGRAIQADDVLQPGTMLSCKRTGVAWVITNAVLYDDPLTNMRREAYTISEGDKQFVENTREQLVDNFWLAEG
jgi:hypothetical protein